MRRIWVAASAVAIAVAAIALIELQPHLASARFLESLILAALGAALAWATRGKLSNGFLAACSLLVGVALLEGTMLLLEMRMPGGGPTIALDSGLSRGRPLVGWGPTRPGVFRSSKVTPDGHVVFDTHVTIDATLNRKTSPSEGARPIVFFGDSWVYGDGVDDDGTLPQAFAVLNQGKIPILNLSFAGWSPAQNLVALREGLYAKLIDHPRHFILFTSPFHIERTACRGLYFGSQAPRFVRADGEVRYVGPCTPGSSLVVPLMRVARRFALYRRIVPLLAMPHRDDVETWMAIVEAFAAQAKRDYGVGTTVLFAPFDAQYLRKSGFTETAIVDTWRKAGLDVLVDRLPKEARYQIPGDGHPTAFANKARAEEIESHLREVDPAALEVPAER